MKQKGMSIRIATSRIGRLGAVDSPKFMPNRLNTAPGLLGFVASRPATFDIIL